MNTKKLPKLLMAFAGVSGCYSVLFGAWLAHAAQMLSIDEHARLTTALQYQYFHTVAIILALLCYQLKNNILLVISAVGFLMGILLFCGSLYIKTLLGIAYISKLAPLGGVIFALSWLLLGLSGTNIFHHKPGK